MRRGVWQKVTLGVLAVTCAVSVTGMWKMRQVHASEMESVGASEQEENIPITAECFPDENFRNYLSEKVDGNGDGALSVEERAHGDYTVYQVTLQSQMDVSEKGIKSLEGIQYFPQLQKLYCNDNRLTTLDVSENTELTDFYCHDNQLTTLDISKNSKLINFGCGYNQLTQLDVSRNKNLESFICRYNQLTTLDVSKNPQLIDLYCEGNRLTALDISKNPKLINLECYNNQLTALDVSQNTQLENLYCSGNCLTSLDVSQNKKITYFEAAGNVYTTSINSKGQLDLAAFPGFQVSKMLEVRDGKVSGTVLIFDSGKDTVTYVYDCGNNHQMLAQIKAVNPILRVTKITLNKTSVNIEKGRAVQLKATITPTTATTRTVTWKSSDTSVAPVDNDGKVTAKAAGTATITCTAKDGSGKKATCKVTVVNPKPRVSKVTLNKTSATLVKGDALSLKATVAPNNAGNKAVSWKSSNTSVATVSSRGKVTAKKSGTAIITCTAKDGSGKKATCKITVRNYTKAESYVARIYTKALGRNPEIGGLKYWAGEINAKRRTPVQVAEQFFFAPEFTNKKLNNTEYVKVLYRTFMGREADKGGLNYWVGRLNKGESRKSVLEAFAGCPEFQKIVKSFGL